MPNLFKTLRRIDGACFNGHLTTSGLVNSKEKAPYRVLHVRKPTFIQVGNTIRTLGGEHIILMEHPDDFEWATTFKAAYAKDLLTWTRPTKVVDAVAHVLRDTGYQSMGALYANFDTPEELKMEKRSETEYRFITGQPVLVDDKVGGKLVKRVVESLGVKIVYAV